ncbi:unnamed protein product [Penicillium discolor]
MDEFIRGFWNFAGDYWWLVFPIMGMAGGVAKAWERGSKRRHERRLEALRMKAQVKTAEIEARAAARQAKHGGPTVVDTTASVAPDDLLARLFAEHDEITARWLDYELDVAKLIAFPAMSDGRQPLTAAFLRAKKTADALRPAAADAKLTEQQIAEYLQAVGDYAVAVDESATQSERNIAYKRVREELDGLILLSDEAVTVLEKQVAKELPSAPAASADHADPVPEPLPVTDPRRTAEGA